MADWRISGFKSGILPDAVAMAKGLGGGFPIGAIWISEKHAVYLAQAATEPPLVVAAHAQPPAVLMSLSVKT